MKLMGRIIHYEKNRQFGFIEQKVVTPGGTHLLKFYFIPLRVVYFEAGAELKVGASVIFSVYQKPPRNQKQSPLAINIEVFQSEETAREAFERYQLIENAGGVE